MKILALDTSGPVGAVAVTSDGATLAELAAFVRARHGETLMPHVTRALEVAGLAVGDLDLVAVGLGPGSFTGLRVGLATAKGLHLALGTPLVGVPTLAVLARALGVAGVALPLVDAARGEVYAAAYRLADGDGPLESLVAPVCASPEEVLRLVREAVPEGPVAACGTGLRAYAALLAEGLPGLVAAPAATDIPRASLLALEASLVHAARGPHDAATLEPLYVRPSDAKLPAKPLLVP